MQKSKKIVAITAIFAVLFNLIVPTVYALPSVEYLGEHPGTFTKSSNEYFVVKRFQPFRFDNVKDQNTLETQKKRERVWRTNAQWDTLFHEWENFGRVEAGCTIEYVAIDDDVDDRINRFYIDDEVVYESPQGMIVRESFTVNKSGTLRLYAEDSIAAHIEVCEIQEPVDICPNIDGMQEDVPQGYIVDANGNCIREPVDVCPNIEGMQETVPNGYILNNQGMCVIEEIPVEDVCPNIDGLQETVPDGYVMDGDDCIEPEEEGPRDPEEEVVNIRFDIKKQVRLEGDDDWEDKVSGVEEGDVIEFKITVKNDSDKKADAADDLKMKDVLPDELEKISGDLTEEWDDFEPGEKRTFIIKARVKSSEFDENIDKCVVNQASIKQDGDNKDTDSATVCYSTSEIEELPETGAASTIALTLMGLSSITSGVVLKRKNQ